ncbi:MAG TPA: ABC transporter permease [Bryobacteraceae bacterium]|nr:ABC transporter permease [Bryobacteraceae bacterium]
MRTLLQNLRYSTRMLRKNLGLTLAIVATLALGIGAMTAIYTVVYSTLLAPLPLPHPEQLVMVWSKIQGGRNGISAGDFLDWQHRSRSFQSLCAFTGGNFNLGTKEEPEQVNGRLTSPGFFHMMGLPFQLGRDFLPEEAVPGKDQVLILTHKLWSRLGADPGIVGRQIRVNGGTYTVVGVLAKGVADRYDAEITAPLAFRPEQINHDYHWLLATGRLKPGIGIAQAQADMTAVTARIAAENPKTNSGWGALVEPLQNDFMPKERIQTLWLLLGAVGFVLLIACVNVANLLLAKGTARQREIAIRSSLGASRRQVFAQFLTESIVLALGGGAIGIGLGMVLLRALVAVMPQDTLPAEVSLQLDFHILAVTLAATVLSGLLFGCAPAWYASRVDPGESLKDGGRAGTGAARNKLRRALVVGEFALALTLLSGAGLAFHSFWNLTRVDLGVRADHVLMFNLNQPDRRFKDPEQMDAYYRQMLDRIHAVPGVSSAAVVTGTPLRGTSDGMPFSVVGAPAVDFAQRPGSPFQSVTPEYFKTFGIRVLQGRQFTSQDTASSTRVAMVNQQFVKQYLKGLNPLTQRLSIEQIIPGLPKLGPAVEWQIVGVFHNVRSFGIRNEYPEIDVPFAQSLLPSVTIGIRTPENPAALTKAIAATVHSIDPDVALAQVTTLEMVKDKLFIGDRFTMLLYGSFALLALVLAAVGIYGVIAFGVSQRTHEIGLRMALGAGRANVTALIINEGSLLALIGLGLGIAGAVFVGRAMQSTLYGVQSADFLVIASVGILLFATALLASYLPARRASSIDPMQALRTE